MSNTKYNFGALLRERETKTIKTVAFCKKLYFKSKQQEKYVGANFALLCQSINMIAQIKKTFLNIPIKIPRFPTSARIQKLLT